MNNIDIKNSVLGSEQLDSLKNDTLAELKAVQAQIEGIEAQLTELEGLKIQRDKLSALLVTLTSLNNTEFALENKMILPSDHQQKPALSGLEKLNIEAFRGKAFFPESAFEDMGKRLPRKGSVSYELFSAVVYQGGRASSRQIRDYLIQQGIRQPQSGETFESVSLSSLNPRLAQLVKKGCLCMEGNGVYWSSKGWK